MFSTDPETLNFQVRSACSKAFEAQFDQKIFGKKSILTMIVYLLEVGPKVRSAPLQVLATPNNLIVKLHVSDLHGLFELHNVVVDVFSIASTVFLDEKYINIFKDDSDGF